MEPPEKRIAHLKLLARAEFLPVVVGFVERTAGVFGLGKNEALQITLAAEELFTYLCNHICPGGLIEIESFNGIYYTKVSLRFPVSTFTLSGLNITTTVSLDAESSLEEMGLIIATRFVDRLNLVRKKHNEIDLILTKEKAYPEHKKEELRLPGSMERITLAEPGPERLKLFALMAEQQGREIYHPSFLKYPGKVVDMVSSGEYRAFVVLNDKEEIGGGILFLFRNEKIVEFFGPFAFHKERRREIGAALIEGCMSRIARTKALGMVTLYGLPEEMEGQFESLGSFELHQQGGESSRVTSFYRLLHEDPGGIIWTHPGLVDFLKKEYDRLVLARDIRTLRDLGEDRSGSSIFSTEFQKERSQAVIRPLWPGTDADENVGNHIQALRKENVLNLFFELDLGIAWHGELIPFIMAHGFAPRMIVPFAGQSDLVFFQYHETKS